MKQLSDLLDEATAGAPPARYAVEDAVAAGRRLQRRRNTGWAIAAVTAVAVTIGVPQIATRRSAPPVQPVVTTTTAPPAVKLRSFVYPFAGYTTGRFRVDDPESVTLSTVRASIWPVAGSGSISGILTIFQPGVVDVGNIFGSYRNVDTAPINGRRAIFLEPQGAITGSPMWGLAWEYKAGGWVFAWSRNGRLKKADLIQVVKRLVLGPNRTALSAFRTAHVPNGYRLVQVDGPARTGSVSGLLFASAAPGGRERSESGLTASPDDLGDSVLVRLTRLESGQRADWPSAKPVCPKGKQYCYRSLDKGRYLLQVSTGRAGPGPAELLKTLAAITVADPDDQGTWIDVNSAAPASAQLPAD